MRKLFIFLFIISFAACKQAPLEIPDDVLDVKTMTTVFSEMHLAQSAINNKAGTDKTDQNIDDYLEVILKKHNITRAEFLKSLKFYTDNPLLIREVLDSVDIRLNRIQQADSV